MQTAGMDVIQRLHRAFERRMRQRSPLRAHSYSDALIAPLRFLPNQNRAPESLRAETGVYSANGSIVKSSLLHRNNNELGSTGSFESKKYTDRDVIFAGPIFDHFGHFLLEGISRLWGAEERPDHAIAWSTPEGEGGRELAPWQQEIIERLCGKRKHIFVSEATTFGRVTVPDVGYRIQDYFHPDYAAFLERVGKEYVPVAGLFVWLSRSKIEPDSGLLGSQILEERLGDTGWKIVYPEQLSIEEQLEILSCAERVAGEEGSALHLPLLLKGAQGLRLDIFPRKLTVESVKRNYLTIARAKGFDQHIHALKEETLLDSERSHQTRISPNFSEYLNALGVFRKPFQNSTRVSDFFDQFYREIGASNNTKYLQLGWSPDQRFLAFDAQNKTLVAERPTFDPRVLAGKGHTLYEMPPRLFFEQYSNSSKMFDVIHVTENCTTGHHNSIFPNVPHSPDFRHLNSEPETWIDQLLGIFVASRSVAHDRTVWLIGGPDFLIDQAKQLAKELSRQDSRCTVELRSTSGNWLIVRPNSTNPHISEVRRQSDSSTQQSTSQGGPKTTKM